MAQLAINLSSATILRQANRVTTPDPVHLAVAAELGGADAVSLHVREKRDLVTDRDVKTLRQILTVPLFLRMAPTLQMTGLALDVKPDLVVLVAEKPQTLAINGGIDLIVYRDAVAETITALQASGLTVCLSVAPDPEQVKIAHRLNATAVEIYTGDFAMATSSARERLAGAIADTVSYAAKLKLDIHVGGALDAPALKRLSALPKIDWFSIGHNVVARALLTGMHTAVKDFQHLAARCPAGAQPF
ncbi:MAG: pyridoxine 5'-phosphate synthase [Pseudomonadota bacterium]